VLVPGDVESVGAVVLGVVVLDDGVPGSVGDVVVDAVVTSGLRPSSEFKAN
jgi:hypothetical protein